MGVFMSPKSAQRSVTPPSKAEGKSTGAKGKTLQAVPKSGKGVNDELREGMSLFDELLGMEGQPDQVADWFLAQMKKLGKPGTSKGIQNVPLFKLAGAFTVAKDWQRQRLAKVSIAGFAALPAAKRACILGLVVESAPAMLPAAAGEEAHVSNLRAIIKEARFDKLRKDELAGLKQTVQSEAIQLANPKQLSEVLSKLPYDDRRNLPDALIRTKLVAPENRDFLEEAVRPDGIVDEAGQAVNAMDDARQYYWVLIVLPLAEGLFAAYADQSGCAEDLVDWLHMDAILCATLVVFALATWKMLGPAYERVSGDLSGAARRWRLADRAVRKAESSDEEEGVAQQGETSIETKLLKAIQLDALTFRAAVVVLGMSGLLAIISSFWSGLGMLKFLQATSAGCISVSIICIAAVVAMRFAATGLIVYMGYRIWDILQRLKMQGSDIQTRSYGSV